MFFCGKCAEERNWPLSLMRSEGKCEVCGKHAVCYDVASKNLPLPGGEQLTHEEQLEQLKKFDEALKVLEDHVREKQKEKERE